jgi:TRAP-type C4-dicarboxylate transport system permease small subunit
MFFYDVYKMTSNFVNFFFKTLRLFSAICLAVMVILVFGNVVLRYGFNSGIAFSEEMSRWAFVWMIFVGAVGGLRDLSHLGVDSLVSKLSRQGKLFCYVISHLLMIAIVAVFLYGSFLLFKINFDNVTPVSGISLGWYFSSAIFFSVCAIPILFFHLYRATSGQISDKELIAIKESEEDADLDEILKDIERSNRSLKKD